MPSRRLGARISRAMRVALLLAAAPAARAQYPLVPSPVLSIARLGRTPAFSGYVSARGTRRNDSTGFIVNRARLTAVAAPRPFVAVRLQGDFSGQQTGRVRSDSTVSGFTLTDAYVQLAPPAPSGRMAELRPALIVGQFKQPFSLEYLTSFATLRTANRSQVVDRLSPRRDVGAMGQIGWARYVTLAASVVDGEGANTTANPDGRELIMGRLTVSPLRGLALAGKIGNESADHLWGYDGRWLWRDLIVEGEDVHRKHPLSSAGALDAGGGYALAAYRVLPWLEPVYKWDRYWETRTGGGASSYLHSTWSTYGVNFLSRREALRLQMEWIVKHERPTEISNNELLAQLIANF